MMASVPCTFQQAPEALDGVRMDAVFTVRSLVVDDCVRHVLPDCVIRLVFVGNQHAFVGPYRVLDEVQDTLAGQVIGNLRSYVAITFDRADNRRFIGAASTLRGVAALLIVVSLVGLAGLAAHVCFVRFDDPGQHRGLIRRHSRPDTLLHVPRGRLIQFQIAGQLVTGQAFLGVADQGDPDKPFLQRDTGFFHDGSGQHVKRGFAIVAIPTANTVSVALTLYVLGAAAMRAVGAVLVPDAFQVVYAGLLVGEASENLDQVHGVTPYGVGCCPLSTLQYTPYGIRCQAHN